MSELVTCLLALLNGFSAVLKLATNQKLWPNGLVSGVPNSSESCARAALLDMAIATAHAAPRTVNPRLMIPLPRDRAVGARTPRAHPLPRRLAKATAGAPRSPAGPGSARRPVTVEVRDVAPGLWLWRQPHPHWSEG